MQHARVGEHEPRREDVRETRIVIEHREEEGNVELEHEMTDETDAGRLAMSAEASWDDAQRSRLRRDLRGSGFAADLETSASLFQRRGQERPIRFKDDVHASVAAHVADHSADPGP